MAYSSDGLTWSALNGGHSVVRPQVTGHGVGWMEWNTTAALMRDPCVLRGPDGVYHMVWTIAWTDKGIGLAHSRDLIHWSKQERIPVMDHEPTTLNAWAPELFYDEATQQYIIFWASSIPGRFPASDSVAQRTPRGRADHREYYVTTKDFTTYSAAKLLYDGGFAAIDGTIKKSGDTYFLVMKDETFYPKPVRALRVAASKSATGPYGPASPPFTAEDTEGPSILHVGDWWYVYYDEYTRGRYGAVRTRDFSHWEAVTDSLHGPRGMRHGSAFFGTQSVLDGLLAMDSLQRASTTNAPYRDATRPVNDRVHDLIARMTTPEKFWQLYMSPWSPKDTTQLMNGIFGVQLADGERGSSSARQDATTIDALQNTLASTRLGVPAIPFEEAVHGLRRPGATMFPAAIGLAATFDTSLMTNVATAIARETRSRGIRQVLSPVVNLASDVRWGRVEETYGEDPVLSSAMAVAYVRPFEKAGVIATPKHFVANVGEGGRDSYPIEFSRRKLEERFFPPFREAIQEGGAGSIMSAYNLVDGTPASQNSDLLTNRLRAWDFHGFVISDAAAVGGATVLAHTEYNTATATQHALGAGLDVIFQSSLEQARPYLDVFQAGLIPDSVVDSAVARVLHAKFSLGLFDHPRVDPDSAADWNGNAAHRQLALQSARESIVLLRNSGHVLPLARGKRIAVIGQDAERARLGGYSSTGNNVVSILAGIQTKIGDANVRYVAGPGHDAPTDWVVPADFLSTADSGRSVRGLRGEYFDNNRLTGTPRLVRIDPRVDFGWTLNSPGRGIPFDWYSVRWTGTLLSPANGVRHIGVEGNDGYRLWIDGKLVVDDWEKRGYSTHMADLSLAPGSTHDLKLEFFESTGNARVKLVWDAGAEESWRTSIDSAVDAARASDAAVVVAGIEEGEFRDRARLGLPGHQEELIDRVAATGKPTVVVLVGGSAITMPWLERVSGVVDVWYPGEAGGEAVADVLFGDANPSGRLPITFPVSEGQLPLFYDHKPTGRGDDYVDLTGQPLFPFGYGLSYTTFAYGALSIEPRVMEPGRAAIVHCRVKNTGDRAGGEVVQLYLRELVSSVARPVIQLEGFQRVHLQPGEEREITFPVGTDQLKLLDAGMHWTVEPGTYRLLIGASSRDIRLRGDLIIQ